MSVAVITGSAGLIGPAAARHFAVLGMDVVGIDNDMRLVFFGEGASTSWQRQRPERTLGPRYRHVDADIREGGAIREVFGRHRDKVELVVHEDLGSMAEAISLSEQVTGREMARSYREANRVGDHLWWVSDTGEFRGHYPGWEPRYDVPSILREIYEKNVERRRGGSN